MNLAPGAVAVVTGANTGIGKETALGLAQTGATTVLACRNLDKAKAAHDWIVERSANDDVHVVSLDLADLDSVRACADEILTRWDRLDVLVNNAGGVWKTRQTTKQGFEYTFGVNHLGHFLLTKLLLDRIKASAPARIINVSSIGHHFARNGLSWDDLQRDMRYRSNEVYCETKLANIYFTRALAKRLAGSGVTVNALHPGGVRTEFGSTEDMGRFYGTIMKIGGPFLISPARGAKTSIHLATASSVEGETGGYYVRSKPGHPSKRSQDDEAAERLWQVSEELLA